MSIFKLFFGKHSRKQERSPESRTEKQLAFSGYAVSDVGLLRENNEDNYFLESQWNRSGEVHSESAANTREYDWILAGIFDGMGGGEAGEMASGAAAQAAKDAARQLKKTLSGTEVDEILRKLFQNANNAVVELQKQMQVFGTTGTLLCTNGVEFKIYHSGDSRAYLVREKELFLLTKDQTLAQMKIEMGMYDQDAPQAEAEKHKLVDYIGRDSTRENFRPVESCRIPIRPGDGVLLCSDGLYDMCSGEEILRILGETSTPKEKAAGLVAQANANGGVDNTTCIYIAFG